jgi:hypothetical protein
MHVIDLSGVRVVIEQMRPDLLYCYESFESKIQAFAIERYDGYPFLVTSLMEPCELEIYATYMSFMNTYCAYCKRNGKECDDLEGVKEFIAKYGPLIVAIVAALIELWGGYPLTKVG